MIDIRHFAKGADFWNKVGFVVISFVFECFKVVSYECPEWLLGEGSYVYFIHFITSLILGYNYCIHP
jgi:hypothetical protein